MRVLPELKEHLGGRVPSAQSRPRGVSEVPGATPRAVQVAPADVQALGLAAVLDCSLPLDSGGLLFYDAVHSVWLYEADAVQARLHGLKDVRPHPPPLAKPQHRN